MKTENIKQLYIIEKPDIAWHDDVIWLEGFRLQNEFEHVEECVSVGGDDNKT